MLPANALQLNLDIARDAEPADIPGLTYMADYISPEEAGELLASVDREFWSSELKRRVQHYGYQYNYKKRAVSQATYLGALPDWAEKLASRFHREGVTAVLPDQAIVNEYQPGQGIARHIDCVSCFGETILSVSLGSACVMNFTKIGTAQKVPLLLQPGSLIVLQGEARYQWQHGIPPRKRDKYRGSVFLRSRRVSLTFRKVLIQEETRQI